MVYIYARPAANMNRQGTKPCMMDISRLVSGGKLNRKIEKGIRRLPDTIKNPRRIVRYAGDFHEL